MKIITINLPERYVEAIQALKQSGKYPSRSKAVRVALKEFLGDELRMFMDLEKSELNKMLKEAKCN
jgi:Arc/MetJ-type ribon-helix-helix transcriptional regulator